MNIKMKWKRLLTGFFCMMLLACNAGSVFAENTDVYNPTVSGNDISGNDSKRESGETETEENVTDKNGGEEPRKELNRETSETVEDLLQPLSLETDVYDTLAADRTYTAGENITAYYFEADGILYFEGTGTMADWTSALDVPWHDETIRTVVIGEGITTVGDCAFRDRAELTEASFPDTLEFIGSYAFSGNSLTEISIPDSVTTIKMFAFNRCTNAAKITIGNAVEKIEAGAFASCSAVETLSIPDSVTLISGSAFEECHSLTDLKIGNGVKTIYGFAFQGAHTLESVEIPDSVTLLGACAFMDCPALKDITIGNGIAEIDAGTFLVDSQTDTVVKTDNEIVKQYDWAYDRRDATFLPNKGYNPSNAARTYIAGDNIKAYYFETEKKICFEGTGPMYDWESSDDVPWYHDVINTILVGEGITTVGANAFAYHDELSEASLPGSLRIIGSYAFCQAYSYSNTKGNLQNADIPEGVEEIGDFAFRGNALETISIPDSVETIGISAFEDCSDALSLHIGAGVTQLKKRAFFGLKKVQRLKIPGNIEIIPEQAFYRTGAVEIVISDGVKMIGREAFGECKNAERITFGDSVETIGNSAFIRCEKLKTLEIPDSVVQVGNASFGACHSLTDLTFGSGLEMIDSYAFNEAYMLENVEIPDNVIMIGSSVFNDSRSLREISIGRGITRLGYGVFMVSEEIETTVVTENNAAMRYGWENDRRKVTFKSKVIFKDHAGNILKNITLEHGDTVLDKAPDMGDYEDQGYTYTFTGWLPEITGETKVTGGAEYTARYDSDAPKTVTFVDYDGSIILQKIVDYNSLIFPIAPIPQRADSGLNSYTFQCWSPALTDTDRAEKDVTYTAKYARKTQYAIQADYEINIPEGSSFGHEDIKVYPVYKVFDENNRLTETIRDEGNPIAFEDISLSKDRIERGVNEIEVEQLSTGLTITAEIFGCYTDGIVAWHAPEELEEGTVLTELDVYFTRTIMDKAGEIEENLPDLGRKVEDYELNGGGSVAIVIGDNKIRITDKESGEEYETTVNITGVPKESYHIVFKNHNGQLLKEVDLAYGAEILQEAPSASRESDTEYTYTFTGWFPELAEDTCVTCDAEYIAQYAAEAVAEDPQETISGNDPTDKKDETTSGNDPSDKKDETTSGNDPSDKKDETSSGGPDRPAKDTGGDAGDDDKKPGVNINVSVSDIGVGKPDDKRRHIPGITDNPGTDATREKPGAVESADDGTVIKKTGKPVKTGDDSYTKLFITAAASLISVILLILLCGMAEDGSYIKLLIGGIFFGKNKNGFHGILTKEENPYLTVDAPKDMTETVQDVIDRTDSMEECIATLRESKAVTYLPFGTRISVFYTEKEDVLKTICLKAKEEKLFAALESLSGKEEVIVRFTNEAAKLHIRLCFQG